MQAGGLLLREIHVERTLFDSLVMRGDTNVRLWCISLSTRIKLSGSTAELKTICKNPRSGQGTECIVVPCCTLSTPRPSPLRTALFARNSMFQFWHRQEGMQVLGPAWLLLHAKAKAALVGGVLLGPGLGRGAETMLHGASKCTTATGGVVVLGGWRRGCLREGRPVGRIKGECSSFAWRFEPLHRVTRGVTRDCDGGAGGTGSHRDVLSVNVGDVDGLHTKTPRGLLHKIMVGSFADSL